MIKPITKYNDHNCSLNFDNNLKTTVTQEPIGSCVTVITNTHLRMPLNCEVINNWKWKCMWVCNSKKTWRLYVPISSFSNYLHNFDICAWSKANLRLYLAVICQFKMPNRSSSMVSTAFLIATSVTQIKKLEQNCIPCKLIVSYACRLLVLQSGRYLDFPSAHKAVI